MLQKGPGEGYHAAKYECLSIDSALTCRKVDGGYAVFRGYRCIGAGRIARDAWNEALATLKDDTNPWER